MIEKDIIDHLISDWKNQRPELDPSAMEIVGRIMQLGKKLEKSAGIALKDSGIYYTDLDVLATLRRSGEPYLLTPKQLRESVLVTSGAMTALLGRLEKMELVYRSPDPKDGRIKAAVLTEKGVAIIDKAIEVRFAEASQAIHSLSEKERKQLVPLLKKLLFTATSII